MAKMHVPVMGRDIKESTTTWQSRRPMAKCRQWVLVLVPLNDPVVSCNRPRLAMIRESNPQFRLPKLEDAVRLQQVVGKRSLLEILSCSPAS